MELLTDSIELFLHHCKFEKNLSVKTLKAYKIDLHQFCNFLYSDHNINELKLISKNELRLYIASLVNLKPKSIKRKIAAIKAMYNFLEFEGYIESTPFRKLKLRIKEPQILPTVLDLKEINKIYNTAYQVKHDVKDIKSYTYIEALRNVVVIELLFTTGARVSEISNLKISSINLESGVLRISGKGKKERIIQICNRETIIILRQYIKLNNQEITKSGYLLTNRLGNRLTEQSIRTIVKRYSVISGITKPITPHTFRHSFATLLLEKDVDIKYIQSMLGHSSIMTTQIYTHVNTHKQRQILKSKHPRKMMNMLT